MGSLESLKYHGESREANRGVSKLNLALLLIGYSLSVSPISATYHFDSEMLPTPRHLWKNSVTWHPQCSVGFDAKYVSLNAFYMPDSYQNHSGGFLFGPKIGDAVSIGVSAGVRFREPLDYNRAPFEKRFGPMKIGPLLLAHLGFKIPVAKDFFLGSNFAVTPALLNVSLLSGWRF